jgi:hypothetical protein
MHDGRGNAKLWIRKDSERPSFCLFSVHCICITQNAWIRRESWAVQGAAIEETHSNSRFAHFNDKVINEQWLLKDVKGSGWGVFRKAIFAYAWRKRKIVHTHTHTHTIYIYLVLICHIFHSCYTSCSSHPSITFFKNYEINRCTTYFMGQAVAQLVEALCFKSEVRGFDSRWGYWNFSLT